ncbi:DsrH/TusB family sulfur metabolism protein [Acinetobacter towneri]|uniref:Sulfurtransferase complex subunit TusB n=1 Tax=Acinetobacter towneri TaxID=202956 RepID=A0A1E8DZX3_9GAMM|nr:DsrH/TusB family sulfur metabolism protein [Acinetobacter towneri]OFE42930.1 hypothetical protein BJN41_11465 [Acinetobacter towneri]
MTDANLYLIQASFDSTTTSLAQLNAMYAPQDSVVLMGDAVLHQHHPLCAQLDKIYVLENDAEILNGHLAKNVHPIDYAAFATLCLAHQRCISLK